MNVIQKVSWTTASYGLSIEANFSLKVPEFSEIQIKYYNHNVMGMDQGCDALCLKTGLTNSTVI